jgi:hypothetical protein
MIGIKRDRIERAGCDYACVSTGAANEPGDSNRNRGSGERAHHVDPCVVQAPDDDVGPDGRYISGSGQMLAPS